MRKFIVIAASFGALLAPAAAINAFPGATTNAVTLGDPAVPSRGPVLLEGTQAGAVIYRVDGGDWMPVTPNTTVKGKEGIHTVQVAYKDRPGSYVDNSGSLILKVVRD